MKTNWLQSQQSSGAYLLLVLQFLHDLLGMENLFAIINPKHVEYKKQYHSSLPPPATVLVYEQSDIPVGLELFVAQIFFLPGPWYDTLSSRLSFVRSGVTRRHHVLNVFNQRVTSRRHDDLKIRQPWSTKHYARNCIIQLRLVYTQVSHCKSTLFIQK